MIVTNENETSITNNDGTEVEINIEDSGDEKNQSSIAIFTDEELFE